MTKQYLTLVGSEEIIQQLEAAAALEGVELGKSRSADPLTDAVDSTLGPEEIKAILSVITVAVGTSSAALAFFERLQKLLQSSDDKVLAPVDVKEGRTGRRIAKVDRDTDPKELVEKLYK